MVDDVGEFLKILGVICLITIVLSAIVECGILIYAYATADEVHCSWWGCEFTTTRTSSNTTISSSTSQSCYSNGIPVNCSTLDVNKWFQDD